MLATWARQLQDPQRSSFVSLFYLDKLVSFKTSYGPEEQEALLWLEKIIENIAPQHRLVLVSLRDTLVPLELYSHSPKTNVLAIPLPDQIDRRDYLQWQLGDILTPAVGEIAAEQRLTTLSQLTDGMYLRDLDHIVAELRERELAACGERDLKRLINKYRLGEQEDYWSKLDIPKLNDARQWFIQERHYRTG